jgi:hypothetical protein
MIVVTDRLGKGIIADGLPDLEVKTVAKWFIRRYYLHHFLLWEQKGIMGNHMIGAIAPIM